MSDIAIKVENLSKRYRIGLEEELPDTLVGALTRPLRNWRRLRRLTHFDDGRRTTNDQPTPSDSESSSFVLRPSSASEASPRDTLWALRDVSFEVQRGEVVGIIGRNGAGKSTLLKILARITHPTSGRAVINGRIGSLLEVGTGFHPELTGRENIYLNGTILGMTRAEVARKFDEIVAFSGVEKFIDTPVKRYSSGMRVRLAFSVAAHLDPEILLVDEVLAVGDAGFQKKCLGKMGEVASEGRTVLFVSHNMTAIQGLCEHAIWLEEGSITEEGLPGQVVSNYLQTSFSASNTKRIWKDIRQAPGNDRIRIHRISVSPGSTGDGDSLYINQDIQIIIDFWSLKMDQDLSITLHFITSDAVVAFSTSTIHDQSLRGKRLSCGLYRARCRIPANLLNDKTYRVRLYAIRDQSKGIFKIEEALIFEVLDSAEWREVYFGERPGAVAPMLKWNVQFLQEGMTTKN